MDKLLEFVAPLFPHFYALLFPNLEENAETLQSIIRMLKSRKDDFDDELEKAARSSGKKRKREVDDWMNSVEDIDNGFRTLAEEVQQSSRYNVFKRQKLAEQVERFTAKANGLDQRSTFPRGLSLPGDDSRPNGQGFQQNSDDIWTSLMNADGISIGIYGMGGVGKTTLARHVHDKLKELGHRLSRVQHFSGHVYWVTVSREFSISKLQNDIAQALNLQFSRDSDETERANQLIQAFQKMERFVLILDDVWQQIDAGKIGIPLKRKGCKLVITSQSQEVCQGMDCQNIIEVKTLSNQKALDLFLKTLNRGELHENVKPNCEQMVNKCEGLPLSLITLAGSMRDVSVTNTDGWSDALEALKYSFSESPDKEDKVLPILSCIYDRLGDPRLKNCFLHCSLYPEDSHISRNQVIENFISEELMESRLSMQAEVEQGHAILTQLEGSYLLERYSDGYLKMHDLIRDMAIWITKDKPRYMVKAGLHLEELPEEQEWTEDLVKVSLMKNRIKKISPGTSPNCPSLFTLFLSENPLRFIPDGFFTHMCGLHTLDLSETEIESLPNSISHLEKLNALLLRRCFLLVSVPPLEKLKELRHLDLTDTRIEVVPQGMENLTKLKRLSLSCDGLKMIPMGTLHRLTHLQQLKLPYNLDAPIEEVVALKQLEEFHGKLKSVHDLNLLINSRQIDKQLHFYNIRLSSQEIRARVELSLPCKHLHFGKDSLMKFSLDTNKNMLPRDIESLSFSSSGLSGRLLDEFPIWNYAGDLKECRIDKEDKIECIMRLEDEQQSSTGVPFQSLNTMYMSGLPNLIGLFKWEAVAPLPLGTFSCLKHLTIEGCGKIKKLFPQSLAHNFHNLQELTVKDCVQMEEIIEDDNNEGADFTLPMLKKLTLVGLPQLKSICKGTMICDSLQITLTTISSPMS